MIITTNNFRRMFKKKLAILLIVLIPALLLLLANSSVFSGDKKLKVGISDQDQTALTAQLTAKLADQTRIKPLPAEEIPNELFNSKIDYALVVEKGFTAKLLTGEDVALKGYYLRDAVQTLPVQKYVDTYITSAKEIARTAGKGEQEFYESLQLFNNSRTQFDYQVIRADEKQKSYYILGAVLEIILVTTLMLTTLIQSDRENKTFVRTLIAPVTLRSYMFQNVLSFLLVAVIQVTLIFVLLKYIIGIYLGSSVWLMYLLYLSAAVLAVSLGVAVNAFTRNVVQASFTGIFISFLLVTLGGSLWEHEQATALLRNIGKFTPAYWIMEGVSKVLKGEGLLAVGGDIGLVLLFALVFFLLGTWKKEDVAR